MISSGHAGKYSCEIPHKYLLELLGDFFSKWRFLFSHMLQLFQNSFIFGEATYSHFFRVTTSTQQLLFRSSYFFRAAAFFEELLFQNCHFSRRNYFFRTATFSEQNFYRAVTFWERKFFKAVTFRNSYLFGGGVV